MKLTKSYQELNDENKAFMRKWHGKRKKVFLWRPTKMFDGSVAWLQFAWLDYCIEWNTDKTALVRYRSKLLYEDIS